MTDYDLTCFSYLAASMLMEIEQYPALGSGTEVKRYIKTLSADGPITAIVAARLGLKTFLLSNMLGNDQDAMETLEILRVNNVDISNARNNHIITPKTTVLCDATGGRTWFSFLPNVLDYLLELDFSCMQKSRFAYIDYYPIIENASRKALEAAANSGIPMLVNLGGALPGDESIRFLRERQIDFLQTNHNFISLESARTFAYQLQDLLCAKTTLVTLGERGVLAIADKTELYLPAYSVEPIFTNGAGASFSAAFIYSTILGSSLEKSLSIASAAGAINCSKINGFVHISPDKLNSTIKLKTIEFN